MLAVVKTEAVKPLKKQNKNPSISAKMEQVKQHIIYYTKMTPIKNQT